MNFQCAAWYTFAKEGMELVTTACCRTGLPLEFPKVFAACPLLLSYPLGRRLLQPSYPKDTQWYTFSSDYIDLHRRSPTIQNGALSQVTTLIWIVAGVFT